MAEIWCEIKAALIDGRIRYRGVVRMGEEATWRGLWRDKMIEAQRDAEKQAEKLYDLNHNVLIVSSAKRPRTVV